MSLDGIKLPKQDTYGNSEFDIYELTWNIPNNYGGMTSAMLYRTEQFERFDVARRITILTLAAGLDPESVAKANFDRWGISDRVQVRNIWHDLRTLGDHELLALRGEAPTRNSRARIDESAAFQTPFMKVSRDDSNQVIRRQHFRSNGSLVLSDELQLAEGRRLTLFDSNGNPVRSWKAGSDLYLSWLKFVVGDVTSVIVNEDKRIGEFLYRLEIPNAKVVQVIHGTHLANRRLAPFGPLLKLRNNTIKNISQFDQVTVLTQSQFNDIAALGVNMENVSILPNATAPRSIDIRPDRKRNEYKGTVIGKLTPLKRVDHSVAAISKLFETQADSNISLDIIGEGERKAELAKQIALAGPEANTRISLLGHIPNASSMLDLYSFLLLTSTSEGQSLVLLEAMSQGCIPIAYNIRYGPSDLIVDGVNGFLVEPGDIDSLARTIRYFVSLPQSRRADMRLAAQESVRMYYPAENMRRWSAMFSNLLNENSVKHSGGHEFSAKAVEVTLRGSVVKISGQLAGDDFANRKLYLVATTRDGESFVKSPLLLMNLEEQAADFSVELDVTKIPSAPSSIVDFYVQEHPNPWRIKSRLQMGINTGLSKGTNIYETKHGGFSIDFK